MRRWCVLSVEHDRQIKALQISVKGELPQSLLHDAERHIRRNQVMQVIAFQKSISQHRSDEFCVAGLQSQADD